MDIVIDAAVRSFAAAPGDAVALRFADGMPGWRLASAEPGAVADVRPLDAAALSLRVTSRRATDLVFVRRAADGRLEGFAVVEVVPRAAA